MPKQRLRVGLAPTKGFEDLRGGRAAAERQDGLAEAAPDRAHGLLILHPLLLEGPVGDGDGGEGELVDGVPTESSGGGVNEAMDEAAVGEGAEGCAEPLSIPLGDVDEAVERPERPLVCMLLSNRPSRFLMRSV